MSVATLSVMAGLLLLAVSDARLTAALGVDGPAPHVAMVAFGLLFTPAEVLLGLLSNALSRRQEYAADAFASTTTGDPEALAKALERLASDSLTNLTPHPFYVSLHHGHPPLRARLAALRSL
jgi:STE24 endopeptidase